MAQIQTITTSSSSQCNEMLPPGYNYDSILYLELPIFPDGQVIETHKSVIFSSKEWMTGIGLSQLSCLVAITPDE
jgi:hypothetical protein